MIAIIDYGVGNLASVQKAMAAIDQPAEITGDPARIAKADRLILPGVGAFAAGMANLSSRGLVEPVLAHVASGRPLLGICLGLQLLLEESEELSPDGTRPRGLGIFAGTVRLLPGPDKVPQIGWNTLRTNPGHPSLGPIRRALRLFRALLLCRSRRSFVDRGGDNLRRDIRRRPRQRPRVGRPVPSGEEWGRRIVDPPHVL